MRAPRGSGQSNSPIRGLRNEEINGKTLCVPAGQTVDEIDRDGRDWIKSGKVIVMRPPTVDDCFRLLDNGTVQGVVVSELLGRASAGSLGISGKTRMLDQPLAFTTYHALVSKSHPHARTILYYINSSLGRLRESGEYERIIERHLAKFWDAQSAPSPSLGAAPAARQPTTGPSGSGGSALPAAKAQPSSGQKK